MIHSFQTEILLLIKDVTGQKNLLTIPREFIAYTGDVDSALFLSQLCYWTGRAGNPDGWIAKTFNEWEEELGFNEYYVRKVRRQLEKKMGIIETKVKMFKGCPTVYYRVKRHAFGDSFLQFLQERSHKTLQVGSCEDQRNQSVNIQDSYTDTSTEISTNISFSPPTPLSGVSEEKNSDKIFSSGPKLQSSDPELWENELYPVRWEWESLRQIPVPRKVAMFVIACYRGIASHPVTNSNIKAQTVEDLRLAMYKLAASYNFVSPKQFVKMLFEVHDLKCKGNKER